MLSISRALRELGVSARVWHAWLGWERAVDEEILAERAVEAGGERVALEPIVDGYAEPVVLGKALHLQGYPSIIVYPE